MIGEQLERLRKQAKPGRCVFCKRRIDRGYVCTRKVCHRAYQREYARDNRRKSQLRAVMERIPSPKSDSRILEVLSCGHILERFKSIGPGAKRRRCTNPACMPNRLI